MVSNYDGLSADETAKVPETFCNNTNVDLAITKSNAKETECKKTESTKLVKGFVINTGTIL